MAALSLLFSFKARLARGSWWLTAIALGITFTVLFVFIEEVIGRAETLALYPFFFWIAAAISVKRLHDAGKTGWWLLILIIPILGPLWLFILLAFKRGTPGENQYGDDPLTVDADYLKVKINP
ncbi:DUF805 domain-containing protein [Andreprevotia chitinilytica]|uniref:DUF805 domain-containing protein n=1 Tax=Andreprevotia chitinilytica TaxID=396808 RepID=UPI000555BE3B|nr:DUF805 domain-containing protein [Andreprevotia chitinilytica]